VKALKLVAISYGVTLAIVIGLVLVSKALGK
jgi:hypothetical protein